MPELVTNKLLIKYHHSFQGDKFMKNRKRISVKITGKIKGYSDFEGLLINPCKIN